MEADQGDGSIFKALMGLFSAVITFVVLGVIKSALGSEKKIVQLEAAVEELRKVQINKESVQDAIEKVLEKRDKTAEQRHAERNKLHALEMREAIREELRKITPEIVREIKANTGAFKRPDAP